MVWHYISNALEIGFGRLRLSDACLAGRVLALKTASVTWKEQENVQTIK